MASAFVVNPRLVETSRLPVLSRSEAGVRPTEWAVWLSLGVVAACAAEMPDWNRQIPGHAILRSVFPMALGLALAPRRFAGAVMASTGLVTAWGLQSFGSFHIGLGGLTSLAATGFCLDALLVRARSGWRLYLAFALAGLTSNLLAFGVQFAVKLSKGPKIGGRGFLEWLAQASWTYPLCGLVAGLISGAVWFQFRPRSRDAS